MAAEKDYKIVSAVSVKSLRTSIKSYLAQGWTCQEGVFFDVNGVYMQAMVK